MTAMMRVPRPTLAKFDGACGICNGRISARSFHRYRIVRPFFKRVLADIDRFCVQSEESARRTGGANVWSVISVDVGRGLLFVPTGSAISWLMNHVSLTPVYI